MPLQPFLPGFPEGAIRIGAVLSIYTHEGIVTYFLGRDNFYSHKENDKAAYRFILATLMVNGHVRARDLEQAPLCIPHRTLMNWVRQLRLKGASSFFTPPQRAGARVMTPEKVKECERLLAANHSISQTAREANVMESTLRKTVQRGDVALPSNETPACVIETGATKSERSREDAVADGMGMA